MFSNKKIIKHGLTAFCGCLFGVCFERLRKNDYDFYSSVQSASANINTTKVEKVIPSDKLAEDVLSNENKNEISLVLKYGFPSSDTILNYNNFIISYDKRNRNANWVLERLTPELLLKKREKIYSRSKVEFFEDNNIHEYFRSNNNDFKKSNYDRGHLAASGNYSYDLNALKQTFVLTNVSPQIGKGFNRDIWNALECYVRYRTKFAKNIWICTGPLYLPRKGVDGKNYIVFEVIGKNNISVPTHFFKILLIENLDGSLELESYLFQNSNFEKKVSLKAFQISIDVIERASGLLIFDKIPKNRLKSINGNFYLEKFKIKEYNN